MIEGLFNSGSMQVLERTVGFTGRRHELILHNIANLSTPNFRPKDLSVTAFQEALGRAVDQRRSGSRGSDGSEIRDIDPLRFGSDSIEGRAALARNNILFHDRNDRSLEHQMKSLAENTMTHNAALQLLKGKFDSIERTIREQV